jgi:hypothetical protein
MSTCKSCHHWEKLVVVPYNKTTGVFTRTANLSVDHSIKVSGGYCGSSKLKEPIGGYELDSLVYSYDESGGFWTGPDFGCIHYSAKGTNG